MQNIEISYEKRLFPPEGEPWLETRDGLKYWLVKREPTIGLQISVLTEDPSISMHRYGGGGREDCGSFLFCYKGFQIGFIDHELGEACWPLPPKSLPEDVEEGRRTGTVILRITAVGTPVFDCSAHYARDRDGKLIKDARGRYVRKGPYYRAATDYSRAPTDLTGFNWQDFLAEWRYRLRRSTGFGKKSSAYVTGLSWKDYCAGKRDRFRSRRQQEEMLSIWPNLFTGMRGQLEILRPGARKTLPNGRPVPKRVMRFSDDVIRQFETGELIDGICGESAELNPTKIPFK
ncbi:hypothetical protein FF124_13475 [Martelella lutilitoris]|uniref:Uncharacterized protein n=1 Tax=Martelella lutilitoris TaxID=2583532 RepID=A0A5C4JPP4_9HYPH|nr:hypothetical protein [Martelella lutilitoris]TNB47181.1 hypothetical protein FF124_13475 [Martelella lutilitoris]